MLASSAVISSRAQKYQNEEQVVATCAAKVLSTSAAAQLAVCLRGYLGMMSGFGAL